VQPADLERHEPRLAEIDGLLQAASRDAPEVEALPVAACRHVVDVEAWLVGVRLAELRGDQGVLARLVPEVVVHRRRLAAVLPAPLEVERPRVEHHEAARPAAVGVAQHAHDHVVPRHAVDGVRARVAGLAYQLLGLDHLLDPRLARVVGHVQHVDAREAEARDDQVRAVRSVAGRAAAVPAVVVELVPRVRHRRLVHDPPVLLRVRVHIHDGKEVPGIGSCRRRSRARARAEFLAHARLSLQGTTISSSRGTTAGRSASSTSRRGDGPDVLADAAH
jgi:hypothetical protein